MWLPELFIHKQKGDQTMLELYRNRRSIRKYKNLKVEKEKVEKILEAGLLAPSSMNKKPLEFIVVDDSNTIKALKDMKKGGTIALETAPLVIVILADSTKSDVYQEDASIASTMMLFEAEKLGLGTLWIQIRNRYGFKKTSNEEIKEYLHIPSHLEVVNLLVIGYKDEIKEPNTTIDLNKIHYNDYMK